MSGHPSYTTDLAAIDHQTQNTSTVQISARTTEKSPIYHFQIPLENKFIHIFPTVD